MGDVGADLLHCFAEWRTEYVSDGRTLLGFFVTPQGDGPFYPPIGTAHGDGHRVFNKAVDLWAPDARRFLTRWM